MVSAKEAAPASIATMTKAVDAARTIG